MNPILPGFYPDPSICRVGDTYYVVTSSFEYFPGVPIFESRDLSHFRQIGHVLTRRSQLDLGHAKSSQGIFAPTLRHHQGMFIMITTNMSGRGSFYVTSHTPTGPWSEPTWVQEDGFNMDPSLFFDDAGKVYYTRHGGGERGGIYQAEIDLESGRLDAPPRRIWSGTGGVWPEGPHLFKVGSSYYLVIAEGGTSYNHEVTVARSASPWGPFEPCPQNPILTHKADRSLPIQATGHADLVQAQDGRWWMVFLGIRPWDGAHHHLGRETFLAPVSWNGEGWPVVNEGRPVGLELTVEPRPAGGSSTGAPLPRDDFTREVLPLHYNFVRNPESTSWSLVERPGWLRLHGQGTGLDDEDSVTFVGRRQQHYRCRVSALLDFVPDAEGQQAGLVVRSNEQNHYDLRVVRREGVRRVSLQSRVRATSRLLAELSVPEGPVVLSIEAYPDRYEFFVAAPGNAPSSLGAQASLPLSSEVAGGFTGVYFGMFASRSGQASMPPADFDWFEYQPLS